MLNTAELQTGMKCLYKGKTFIYQHTVSSKKASIPVPPYHVFKDRFGKDKRLSEPAAARDVWVEIEAIASQNAALY